MSITYNGKSVLAIYRNNTAIEQALIVWNWTPRQLYFGGVRGAAYVPDPIDVYGATGLTSFGEGIATLLDEKNGTPILGPELITSGTFVSGITGWNNYVEARATMSWNSTSQRLRVDNTAGTGDGYVWVNVAVTAGRNYLISLNQYIISGLNTQNRIKLYWFNGLTPVGSIIVFTTISNDTLSFFAVAPVGATSFLIGSDVNQIWEIDNVSIRELPDNFAFQSSSSLRPLFGRAPIAGRRNQLTFTEQFENTAWVRSGVQNIATGFIAPDNQPTANQLIEGTGTINGASIRSNTFTWLGAGSLVAAASVYAKEVVGSAKRYLVFGVFFVNSRWGYVVVDLATGEVTRTSVDGIQTSIVSGSVSVQPAANGYYRVSIAVTSPLAGNSHYLRIGLSNTPTPTFTTADIPSYTGDGTSSIMIWGAQAEIASAVSAYQRVGSNLNDVTEPGVTSYPYIRMDLSDDALNTTGLGSTKNLLRFTEEFDNAAWVKTTVTLTHLPSEVDPFGNIGRVYRLQIAGGATGQINQALVLNWAVANNIAFYVKQNGGSTSKFRLFLAGSQTSSDFTATTSWERYQFSGTRAVADSRTSGLLNPSDLTTVDILIWGAQLELGSTATTYEYGGFKGTALVAGRSGTAVESITLPDGNFSLGPTSYTGGTPVILRPVGDIVGYNLVNKTLTPKERKYLIEYYKDRGAKGLLVPGGPELVSSASSWTGSANWSVNTSTGTATITAASSSGDDLSIGSLTSEIGKHFITTFTIQSITGGTIRVNGSRVTTGAGLSVPGTYTSVMSVTITGTGSLTLDVSNAGVSAVVSNISVKELRPEEEWV